MEMGAPLCSYRNGEHGVDLMFSAVLTASTDTRLCFSKSVTNFASICCFILVDMACVYPETPTQ